MRSLTLAALLAVALPSAAVERTYVAPRTAATPDQPPYSGAVKVGDTLYVSGHLGLDAERKVPAEPEAEARNVLEAFQKTLAGAGMTMDDLVFVQVFCSDVAHFDTWNKVYRTYFKKEFPARAFLGSGKLLFGARFELQGIAVKR